VNVLVCPLAKVRRKWLSSRLATLANCLRHLASSLSQSTSACRLDVGEGCLGDVLPCAIAAPDVVTTTNAANTGIDAIMSPVIYGQRVARMSAAKCGYNAARSAPDFASLIRATKRKAGYAYGQPALGPHYGVKAHNTLLLSFTASASTYTSLPICLNFSDICAMPCSLSFRLAA
jgi:hypothetical protein